MKKLTLKAVPENIPKVNAFINDQLKTLDCLVKTRVQLNIAIDELFANIANYAYSPGTGDATVCFSFDESTRQIFLTFMDHGNPFNPLERSDPDVTLPAKDRDPGGLGIFLVKKMMDSIEYQYKDGQNILTIGKKI